MSSNAREQKANIFKGQDCSLFKIMYFYGGYFTLKQNWALNLSAKVFSKKSTNWGHYFNISNYRPRTAILQGHPNHAKV